MKPAPTFYPAGTIAECIVADHGYEREKHLHIQFMRGELTALERENEVCADQYHKRERRIEVLRDQIKAMEGTGE